MAEEAAASAMQMPAHGEFCWTEIASDNLEACKTFYSNVFGWQFDQSQSTGSELQYLEFSSCNTDQKDGALYEMQPMMFGGTIPPPHIALYVSVDNVDESAAKATAIGGSIVFGPYDIPNVGRMTVINDPTGAAITLITLSPGDKNQ